MDLNTSMSMPILFNFDCFQGLHRTKLGIGKSPVETRIVMTGCWFDHGRIIVWTTIKTLELILIQ